MDLLHGLEEDKALKTVLGVHIIYIFTTNIH